jgi:signal transduction histidine kinase
VNNGLRMTAVVNALSFGAFGAVAHVACGFIRRLGDDADAARARAVEAGRHAELDRHRLLLHDQETVLRLLSQPVIDPLLAGLLQQQAASGASRIRSFLRGEPGPAQPNGTLAAIARQATADFADLPLTVITDLAEDTRVDHAAAEPLRQAITTLLHNVRRHAAATSVVVHAAAGGVDEWELSVHDDGRGFDPAATPWGFGLTQQVVAALRPHAVTAEVTTTAGDGTLVVLRHGCRR